MVFEFLNHICYAARNDILYIVLYFLFFHHWSTGFFFSHFHLKCFCNYKKKHLVYGDMMTCIATSNNVYSKAGINPFDKGKIKVDSLMAGSAGM